MLRTADRRVRPGFTLVELLVAAAVCVLIMAILAGAFSLGIDTVRQMKGTGDMMDQLRGAGVAMKDDLKAAHFLDDAGQPKKLSEFRMDQISVKKNTTGATPQWVLDDDGVARKAPVHGFVRIRSTDISGTTQPDADRLTNGTGVATDHYLHFTSILEGRTDDDYFRASALDEANNLRSYHSIAAEIAYFLEGPVGTTPGGTNLFRLIRRQRLLAISDTDRRDRPWPGSAAGNQAVISLRPSGQPSPPFILNTLADVTNPNNRLGRSIGVPSLPVPTSSASDIAIAPMLSRPGEDTVLSNVLSFEVQVAYVGSGSPGETVQPGVPPMVVGTGPGAVAYPREFTPGGVTESPFDTLPPASCSKNNVVAGNTYDSWSAAFDSWRTDINQAKTPGEVNASANVPPLLIRVMAVQIRIRVWDHKTQNARQLTFVQDL